MLLSYIKRRWKTIAAMAIFAAMFAMVFSLYELPAEAVLYASLLCVAVGALRKNIEDQGRAVDDSHAAHIFNVAKLGWGQLAVKDHQIRPVVFA